MANRNEKNTGCEEQQEQGKPRKRGIIISVIALIVVALLMIISVVYGSIIPLVETISGIGVVKTILRLFGVVGAFLWIYIFYIISDKAYARNGSYALSIIVALLSIFCMVCTMFFLPE